MSSKLTLDSRPNGKLPVTHEQVLDGAKDYVFMMSTFLQAFRRVRTYYDSKDFERGEAFATQLRAQQRAIEQAAPLWDHIDLWTEMTDALATLEKGTPVYEEFVRVFAQLNQMQSEVLGALASIAAAD